MSYTIYYIRTRASLLLAAALLLLAAACHRGGHDDTEGTDISMPVVLRIPASESPFTRAPGDPGTYEVFRLPRYAYIFLLVQTDGAWKVTAQRFELREDLWQGEVYGGIYATPGDSIYTYLGQLAINMPERRQQARVYAAMSYADLTCDGNALLEQNPLTEEEVRNVKFDVTPSISASLQDIYSTPYNYLDDDGEYYGLVTDVSSKRPHVELLLYHVAAKLDLIWNVAAEYLQDVHLTGQLAVSRQNASGCLLFRPMENTAANESAAISQSFAIDAGTQWYGRHSFYVIPYFDGTGKYTPTVTVQKSDSNTPTQQTLSIDKPAASSIFTPWMVGKITISKGNNNIQNI